MDFPLQRNALAHFPAKSAAEGLRKEEISGEKPQETIDLWLLNDYDRGMIKKIHRTAAQGAVQPEWPAIQHRRGARRGEEAEHDPHRG